MKYERARMEIILFDVGAHIYTIDASDLSIGGDPFDGTDIGDDPFDSPTVGDDPPFDS